MARLEETFDWLVNGAPGASTPAQMLAGVCERIAATGIPIDQVESFVRTLHPHIVGRSFVWTSGAPVEVRENSFAYLRSEAFRASPIARVCATGEVVRVSGHDGGLTRDAELRTASHSAPQTPGHDGLTDYIAAPLRFLSGQIHAVTFATRAPGGFDDAQVAAMLEITPPLARVGEIFALARTAVNLLNTYVGRNAGERIMAGHIERGDTDTLRAVIWFSDLRGFTALSGTMPPGEIIRMLNDLFECQVPVIEQRGGEVLKFIGDGMLAIFPLTGGDAAAHSAMADAALDVADDAFVSLRALNRARASRGEAPIRFGLALHAGDVAYGNIGGAGRLDFTCIGPAVNLASRLEGLTGKLDRSLVMSRAFAALTTREVQGLGRFELKGVAEAEEVYGLASADPLPISVR